MPNFGCSFRVICVFLLLEQPRSITKLLLTGDSVKNETFLETLRNTLAEVFTQLPYKIQLDSGPEVSFLHLVDLVFTVVRGAVIYARRR
jgi:hypothetical protein